MNASIFEPKVIRDNNILTIKNCNHAKCVSEFLKSVQKILEQGYSDIIIKSDTPSYFPNACVPICGIINFYRSKGIDFFFDFDQDHYLIKCGMASPYQKNHIELQNEKHPFDKIFLYENSEQVADITQAYIDAISHQSLCADGVLSGLIWCINEASLAICRIPVVTDERLPKLGIRATLTSSGEVFCIYCSTALR